MVFSLFFFPVWTVVLSIIGITHCYLTQKASVIEWTLQTWCKGILKFLGVRLQVKDFEKRPQGGCMYLFNHSSFMDIFVMASVVFKIKFGAKIELFSVPFFGRAMRAGGALPIPRKNRTLAIKILQQAEERARQGEQFALAPEGGRGPGGKELAPFKSGPFLFAIGASVPLAPCVIKGADEVWPKGSLFPGLKQWQSTIELVFLEPISTQGYKVEQKQSLIEQARRIMLEELNGLI